MQGRATSKSDVHHDVVCWVGLNGWLSVNQRLVDLRVLQNIRRSRSRSPLRFRKVVILKSGLQNLTWDLGLEEIKWPNVWLIGRVEKVKEVELVDDVVDYFSKPAFTATVDFEKEKVQNQEVYAD